MSAPQTGVGRVADAAISPSGLKIQNVYKKTLQYFTFM